MHLNSPFFETVPSLDSTFLGVEGKGGTACKRPAFREKGCLRAHVQRQHAKMMALGPTVRALEQHHGQQHPGLLPHALRDLRDLPVFLCFQVNQSAV